MEVRPWRDQVEVAQGDVQNEASLSSALGGVEAVNYLVHAKVGILLGSALSAVLGAFIMKFAGQATSTA